MSVDVDCRNWKVEDFASAGYFPMFFGKSLNGVDGVVAFFNGRDIVMLFTHKDDPGGTTCALKLTEAGMFQPPEPSAKPPEKEMTY